jgi:hypothetical protein
MKRGPIVWGYNRANLIREGRYKYGDLALQVGGVSNLAQGPENDCADEDQQQF